MSTLHARDVVAFGQEIGRVLSVGRIIGRAEPYAKVFASSREVKRAVGVVAWAVLEDIALDARIDRHGRLVATTNVRRIAHNLGMSKNAVSKHLGRLREHGFVLHEEQRHMGTGRYVTSWYILDPSACLERFTTTPPADPDPLDDVDDLDDVVPDGLALAADSPVGPCPANGDTASAAPCPSNGDTEVVEPCPMIGDTARTLGPVSHVTGHREMGQSTRQTPVKTQQQQDADLDDEALLRRLLAVGVDLPAATRLVTEHEPSHIATALQAMPWHRLRNPAGWLIRALQEDWYPTPAPPASSPPRAVAEEPVEPVGLAHDAWAARTVAVLDDRDLAVAVGRVTEAFDGLGRRSLPFTVIQLGAWAAHTFTTTSDAHCLGDALRDQLAHTQPVDPNIPVSHVECPDVDIPAAWKTRLRDALNAVPA